MDTPRYAEERNRVMLGNLPDDFLRVHSPEDESRNSASNSVQSVIGSHQPNPTYASAAKQITLGVIQAQLSKNYRMVGKMDPYVRVRIGHSVFETHCDSRGGKLPNWNKTITSYLPDGIKTVHIEVFDEHTLTPDERIAYADYVLTDEALQGKFIDTWIPLSGKQGEEKEGSINITLSIRAVPYWSSVMPSPAPLMVLPQSAVGMYPYYMPGQPLGVPYQIGSQPMQNPNYANAYVPPQPYRPNEEDVKQIQEMFPAFDREVILGVLENCRGNKEQTISSLLNFSDK